MLPPAAASVAGIPVALLFCVYLLAEQYRQPYQGYWLELGMLTLCTTITLFNLNDIENFFIIFVIFIVALLAVQAVNMQRQRLSLQQALITASKLEAAMLRKTIQPHFILNSLMSVTQWIEDDPRGSIRFVESLADEFRLFSQIAGLKLNSVSQEVELARHHLTIMQFRLEKTFVLDVEGDINDQWLPPGIIHTLVENAISHNKYLDDKVVFVLSFAQNSQRILFTLKTPLGKKRNQTGKQQSTGTGTGNQYIRAQLEQAFAHHYRFSSEADNDIWLTRIIIDLPAYLKAIT
jgi:LytS/YehU family sensor histidine kinase